MNFTVELEDDLQSLGASLFGDLAHGLARAVDGACKEGAETARRIRTYIDRTGDLTRSIDGHLVSQDQYGAEGVLEADAPYAGYVETMAERHPGTYVVPFVGPGAEHAQDVLDLGVQVALENATRRV